VRYGEPFDIPNPDEVVFISAFAGGEVFPVHHHPQVRLVLANAVRWAMPVAPILAPATAFRSQRGF
jgi:trehalose utilization protein